MPRWTAEDLADFEKRGGKWPKTGLARPQGDSASRLTHPPIPPNLGSLAADLTRGEKAEKNRASVAEHRLRKAERESKRAQFVQRCVAYGLPPPATEHRFNETRRWRFDFAWPEHPRKDGWRVAVECDGGVWTRGRHVRPDGFMRDQEKTNAAQLAGWIVLRYEASRLYSSLPEIKRALHGTVRKT